MIYSYTTPTLLLHSTPTPIVKNKNHLNDRGSQVFKPKNSRVEDSIKCFERYLHAILFFAFLQSTKIFHAWYTHVL